MIDVRAIQKLRDADGNLIGYTLQQVGTDYIVHVYKEPLKEAVRNGQVNLVNMTLTSDGRLIGHAAKERKPRQAKAAPVAPVWTPNNVNLQAIFTCGKDILCGLVEYKDQSAVGAELKGMKPLTKFELGDAIKAGMSNGLYDNLVVGEREGKKDESGQLDLKACGVTKGSFSKVKQKFQNVIKANGVESKLNLKRNKKDDFIVEIANYDALASAQLEQIVNMYKAIIVSAISSSKSVCRVSEIVDNGVIFYGPDTVNDAKQILKDCIAKSESKPSTKTKSKAKASK